MSTRNLSRKEEIEIATPKNIFGDFHKQVAYEFGFQQGAEWADKTMLDKVCKVIEEMLPNYVELNYVFDEISVNYHKFKNNFISDFRKAMEE